MAPRTGCSASRPALPVERHAFGTLRLVTDQRALSAACGKLCKEPCDRRLNATAIKPSPSLSQPGLNAVGLPRLLHAISCRPALNGTLSGTVEMDGPAAASACQGGAVRHPTTGAIRAAAGRLHLPAGLRKTVTWSPVDGAGNDRCAPRIRLEAFGRPTAARRLQAGAAWRSSQSNRRML